MSLHSHWQVEEKLIYKDLYPAASPSTFKLSIVWTVTVHKPNIRAFGLS